MSEDDTSPPAGTAPISAAVRRARYGSTAPYLPENIVAMPPLPLERAEELRAEMARLLEEEQTVRGRLERAKRVADDLIAPVARSLRSGREDPDGVDKEVAKANREIVGCRRRLEALDRALTDAVAEFETLVVDERALWEERLGETIRAAAGEYEAAIAELESVRSAIATQLSLLGWVRSGGNRLPSVKLPLLLNAVSQGQSFNFGQVVDALLADAKLVCRVAEGDPAEAPAPPQHWTPGTPVVPNRPLSLGGSPAAGV